MAYYNYRLRLAENWWDRRSFVTSWRRIYAGDRYWVPPYYPALHQALPPTKEPHLTRMNPRPVYLEAMARRNQADPFSAALSPKSLLEVAVAAAVVLVDPRRGDRTAYLSLLRCVNDAETSGKLVDALGELLRGTGCDRLIGPCGLSPHLGSGLLQDYWSDAPPLHTPYNPPYLPEVAGHVLRPLARGQLYHLAVPPEPSPVPPAPAQLIPLDPGRLSRDLAPLFAAACPPWPRLDFAAPDAAEIDFLLRWVGRWPLTGWLAQVEDQPVGFVLLQPDIGPHLRRAGGGRNLLGRLWLAWRARRPVRRGRILYMATLPAWRGQGIGRRLVHQALTFARRRRWRSLTLGPLPGTGAAHKFLQQQGARPRQTYLVYHRHL